MRLNADRLGQDSFDGNGTAFSSASGGQRPLRARGALSFGGMPRPIACRARDSTAAWSSPLFARSSAARTDAFTPARNYPRMVTPAARSSSASRSRHLLASTDGRLTTAFQREATPRRFFDPTFTATPRHRPIRRRSLREVAYTSQWPDERKPQFSRCHRALPSRSVGAAESGDACVRWITRIMGSLIRQLQTISPARPARQLHETFLYDTRRRFLIVRGGEDLRLPHRFTRRATSTR